MWARHAVQDTKKDPSQIMDVSAKLPSAVLARLIAEISDGINTDPKLYNRTYNRHNR